MEDDALLDAIEALQRLIITEARGDEPMDEDRYVDLRRKLVRDPRIGSRMPQFVRDCRDAGQLWAFLSARLPNDTAARLNFVWAAFRPLIDEIEFAGSPVERHVSHTLAELDFAVVTNAWERALARRQEDPAGAITAARTLLESVCKHILDDFDLTYNNRTELPKLYFQVSEALNIAPTQHSEDLFKRILGGCSSVVEGLGALRNSLGDAHGSGRRAVRPAERHAQLAVDLAGAVAVFLLQTAEARKTTAG